MVALLGIECWYDRADMTQGHGLPQVIQQAIAAHDIFLRICTASAQHSFYVTLERNIFLGLMAEDQRRGRGGARRLVNLLVDPNYAIEPIDYAFAYIDATGIASPLWLEELRRALLGPAPDVQLVPMGSRPAPPTIHVEPPSQATSLAIPEMLADASADMRVSEFVDDDTSYLRWLAGHRNGYILNCGRTPRPNYLMLHRASCHTISGTPARLGTWNGMGHNVWTGAYMKACASGRTELEQWALRKTGGRVRPCNFCRP